MTEKQWILMWTNTHEIIEPEFFDTYNEAHKEMKKQYETISVGGIRKLNDYDAWCKVDGYNYMWKICYVG